MVTHVYGLVIPASLHPSSLFIFQAIFCWLTFIKLARQLTESIKLVTDFGPVTRFLKDEEEESLGTWNVVPAFWVPKRALFCSQMESFASKVGGNIERRGQSSFSLLLHLQTLLVMS